MNLSGLCRLTRDPELKTVGNGTSVCDLSVAYDTGWGDNKKVTYLDATCWAKTAEIAAEHLEKGRQVHLTGKLEMDMWEGPDGTRRVKHKMRVNELELLPKPAGTGHGSPAKAAAAPVGDAVPF
jgi:single-strand DNA-binding protein